MPGNPIPQKAMVTGMRLLRLPTLICAVMVLFAQVLNSDALATQLGGFRLLRIGETFRVSPFAPRTITGFKVVPDTVVKVSVTDDRSSIAVTCDLVVGSVTLTIELSDGSKLEYVFECIPAFREFAPTPGGGADDPLRFDTGDETMVTRVECLSPLSCGIANQGRRGGFLARCVAQGTGTGKYFYRLLGTDVPPGMVDGILRARCPRD
ncbi:MAG TPA: hypothetical protein VGK88_04070 [bacterium]